MTTFRTFLVSTTIAAMLAGGASAHSAHLRNTPDSAERADKAEMAPGMGRHDRKARGHDRMQMMRQMMRMHRAMMMGDAMPGMGMMTAPGMDMDMDMGMGMLGDMSGMGAMLPGLKADADGDGTVTPEELRERLAALLSERPKSAA